MVVVIDYGLGNVRSVVKILEYLGSDVVLTNDVDIINRADRIILPGVGAFAPAMALLNRLSLVTTLFEAVMIKKKPLLAICIGMQLLANRSCEDGVHNGLGWVQGDVRQLNLKDELTVPKFGWFSTKTITIHPLTDNLPTGAFFYFAHSYHFVPADKTRIAMTMNYERTYVAAISHENIFATQFHPEKSQEVGIKFFENFVQWNPGL